jgi:8-oxo-dGTP pyrophosphatase MutT (NUDIX family)
MADIPLSFNDISSLLELSDINCFDHPDHKRAAVALVIGKGDKGYQLLFIERASHPKDPWSGNIGFPGGKVEEVDEDCRHTAERETMEELGLDLRNAYFLGRLSDVHGAHLPVIVSCFVYGFDEIRNGFQLSSEVKEAFWLPLEELIDPQRRGAHDVNFAGDWFQSPCINLPGSDRPALWGLTYRLVMELLQILGVK